MNTVMKASDFVEKLKNIAKNYKTLYVMGCFGAPMNSKNKVRYCSNHSYNKKAARTKMIQAATTDTFGFDCVCLIKGVLWGWNGDKNKTYGGAAYKANGVPDVSADGMIKLCSDVSTDFSELEVGEAVWTTGHIGVYIGDGLAVECTPSWDNKVQITACNCKKSGYHTRTWKKHGKLPYIEYDVKKPVIKVETPVAADNEKVIWDYLYSKLNNPYAVAGLMGNLYAESALKSNNVQNSYERKLGVSIGDLTMQLEFLYKELSGTYKGILSPLKKATSVKEASDLILTKFERPADQSDKVKAKRAEYGQKYFDKFNKKTTVTTTTPTVKPTSTKVETAQKRDNKLAGKYKINASALHIRAGAGTNKASLGILQRGTVVTNYGYYSIASNNAKWLYVKTNTGLVGFCSARYLTKC